MTEAGRNDPCPCGSGKKRKKCCGEAKPAATQARTPVAAAATVPAPSDPLHLTELERLRKQGQGQRLLSRTRTKGVRLVNVANHAPSQGRPRTP